MIVSATRNDFIAIVMAICVVGFYSAKEFMPKIEGFLFPVVEPAQLLEFSPQPPPSWRSRWSATAHKNRECSYILGSLRWYYGVEGKAHQLVFARFDDKPKIRGKGQLFWDSLIIDLDPSVLPFESYATVRHQCPNRWWETESKFYVPIGENQ